MIRSDYSINVYADDMFGDALTGVILGEKPADRPAGRVLARIQEQLRTALAAEGRRAGPAMSSSRALCEVVGAEAVAHVALARDMRLVFEKLYGVRLPLRGEPSRPRRWRVAPLEVFEMEIPDVPPRAPFVVAPYDVEDGAYVTWFLYERAMTAGGVSREGAKAALREFGHHARTFRVLLDGRIQRVRCLPPVILFITLQLFAEHAECVYPAWVARERRPAFSRASKAFYQTIRGRVLPAMATVPAASEAAMAENSSIEWPCEPAPRVAARNVAVNALAQERDVRCLEDDPP